jgi:hypothetical protein
VPTIELSDLDKRHPGVSHGLALAYCEAAEVCLGRHHQPPKPFSLTHNGVASSADTNWSSPSQQLQAQWANTIDATEAGAYCVALAAIELTSGLYAIFRAETQSGADYYLGPFGAEPDDLENLIRLEVSGIDTATPALVLARLNKKIEQLKNGASNTPGIASVVGFSQLVVASADMP